MRLLLDTHLILWAAYEPTRLSEEVRSLINDDRHVPVFSAASMWEVTIKAGLGRADFTVDPRILRRGLLENEWEELPISSAHSVAVADLPAVHQDPFDRILVAQARVEGIALLTSDPLVAEYGSPARLV